MIQARHSCGRSAVICLGLYALKLSRKRRRRLPLVLYHLPALGHTGPRVVVPHERSPARAKSAPASASRSAAHGPRPNAFQEARLASLPCSLRPRHQNQRAGAYSCRARASGASERSGAVCAHPSLPYWPLRVWWSERRRQARKIPRPLSVAFGRPGMTRRSTAAQPFPASARRPLPCHAATLQHAATQAMSSAGPRPNATVPAPCWPTATSLGAEDKSAFAAQARVPANQLMPETVLHSSLTGGDNAGLA